MKNTGYFQIIASAVCLVFQWSLAHLFSGFFLVITKNSARICLNIFGDFVIQSLENGQHEKWPRSHVEEGKTCGFIPGSSLPDLKHEQKHFIRIP